MSDTSRYSMMGTESGSKLTQSHRPNSIFSRIYSLFRNGFMNGLDDKAKSIKTKNTNSPNKDLNKPIGINAGKVTKPSKLKKRKIITKPLNNKEDIDLNEGQFNDSIKRPLFESLNLSNIDAPTSSPKTSSHKVTYKSRTDMRPQVIQLGPRKAIRINPNSSTSTISLSPPAAPVSPSLEIPASPPTVSLSPPAVSIASPARTFSLPTVPTLPHVMESRLLFKETNDRISLSQQIPTSNTSTPFRSRSRMIRVNTIEDLDEPQDKKDDIQDNNKTSSVKENFIDVLEFPSTKEITNKRKKSEDGQKRKNIREILWDEDNKTLRGESNGKILTETEGNDLDNQLETIRSSNINNIHNPFHITGESENAAPDTMNSQGYIENIEGIRPKENRNQNNVGSNPRNESITKDKTFINRNVAGNEFHKSQFDPNLESPNNVQKEANDVSKLFMSSDIDSEEDRVLLDYKSKSRQYSELKWPGHDSIGDIILPDEPKTPAKSQGQGKVVNDPRYVNSTNKPRLLSDIMAERYKMDGISFLGTFKTTHIPFNAENKSNDDLNSITEDKQESPVYKKFGIDVRKERFREDESLDDGNSTN